MGEIVITQRHRLTRKQARTAAQKVASRLAAEYDMESTWQGDVLHFQRSGVSGRLTLAEHGAKIEIQLGWLFLALARRIEDEVGRQMHQAFSHQEST